MALASGPLIVTERLELSVPRKDDGALLHAIVSHPETARHLGPRDGMAGHFQRFSRNAGSWWLYGYGAFTMRLRDSGDVIGNCGVFHSWRGLGEDFDDRPEAGWILRHDQVGLGLAREAMVAALEWFDRTQGARSIVCMVAPANTASLRLAARLGFAEMRTALLPDGDPVKLFARTGREAAAAD
ncbi:MAG: GNAT family N-acetyltransferase [Croceibacterium sp.]